MSSLVVDQSSQINFKEANNPTHNNINEHKICDDNNLNGKLTNEHEISTTDNTIQNPPTSERLRNIPPVYINNTEIVLLRKNELDKIENNGTLPSNNNSLCKCSKQAKYNISIITAIVTLIIILFFFIKWMVEI